VSTPEKEAQLKEIKECTQNVQSVILADLSGINVATTMAIRSKLREKGIKCKVWKNTLVEKAISGTPLEGLTSYLKGPSAAIISYDDPTISLKILHEATSKGQKGPVVKAVYLDGKVYDAQTVMGFKDMPGKNEIRSMLLSTFQAPMRGFVTVTSAASRGLLTVLSRRAEKMCA
jgi:large subunit ribosomal protein L10